MIKDISREDALAHFGVKGMRWGVRNEPGTGGRQSSTKKIQTTLGGEQMSRMDVLLSKGRGELVVSKLVSEVPSLLASGASPVVSAAVWAASKTAVNSLDSGDARVLVNRGNRYLHNKQLSYKKDPRLAKKNMSEDDIMKKVVSGINPDHPKIGTNMNCRRCTMAYEMRRRGYDVRATKTIEASGQTNKGINSAVGTQLKTRAIGEVTALQSKHPIKDIFIRDKTITSKTGPNAIFKSLKNQPNGSRGEVAMVWQAGGGHSIAYEIVKGKPVLFDTQSGKKFKTPDEAANFYKINMTKIGFTRLDNKPIDEAWVERWVKSND